MSRECVSRLGRRDSYWYESIVPSIIVHFIVPVYHFYSVQVLIMRFGSGILKEDGLLQPLAMKKIRIPSITDSSKKTRSFWGKRGDGNAGVENNSKESSTENWSSSETWGHRQESSRSRNPRTKSNEWLEGSSYLLTCEFVQKWSTGSCADRFHFNMGNLFLLMSRCQGQEVVKARRNRSF